MLKAEAEAQAERETIIRNAQAERETIIRKAKADAKRHHMRSHNRSYTQSPSRSQSQIRTQSKSEILGTSNVSIHNYGRLPELKKPAGYVYVIQDVDVTKYYKIGYTTHPVTRMENFGVKLPFEIEVIAILETDDAEELEQELHQRYTKLWIRGEWFKLTGADIEEILSI